MGRNKSPVDELVDGLDAIGEILDENLPHIKSRIENLSERHIDSAQSITEIRRIIKDSEEIQGDLKKAVVNFDIRLEEVMGTLSALARRIDQLQKSVVDLTVTVEGSGGGDSELADAVKVLEDRMKKIDGGHFTPPDSSKRF